MKTTPTAPAPAPVAAVAPAPVAAPATRLALEFDSLLALFASEARTDLGAAVLRALEPAADEAELRRRRARYEELERLTLEAPLVPGLGEGFGELVARLESGDPPLAGSEILRLAGLLAAGGEAAARIARIDPPCAELGRAVAELADPQPLVRRIGSILRAESRGIDEPARYGGEEFAVALPETGSEGAVEVAERIRVRIEAEQVPFIGRDGMMRITASLGVASIPDSASSVRARRR